jgi:hypothetical protein
LKVAGINTKLDVKRTAKPMQTHIPAVLKLKAIDGEFAHLARLAQERLDSARN